MPTHRKGVDALVGLHGAAEQRELQELQQRLTHGVVRHADPDLFALPPDLGGNPSGKKKAVGTPYNDPQSSGLHVFSWDLWFIQP